MSKIPHKCHKFPINCSKISTELLTFPIKMCKNVQNSA